jgi:hypothetical protein
MAKFRTPKIPLRPAGDLAGVNRPSLRRQGGDDFFEPRIAAQGIPKRQEFQLAIADGTGVPNDGGKLFAGEVVVANPSSDYRQVLNHRRPVD